MRAKLNIEGRIIDVYTLEERDGADEVLDFLTHEHKDKARRTASAGFLKKLEYIADNGVRNLPVGSFKCWDEDGEKFCEVVQGDYRLGCFQYNDGSRKLLLVTHFSKTRRKERRQYKRAVKRKKQFDNSPRWIRE